MPSLQIRPGFPQNVRQLSMWPTSFYEIYIMVIITFNILIYFVLLCLAFTEYLKSLEGFPVVDSAVPAVSGLWPIRHVILPELLKVVKILIFLAASGPMVESSMKLFFPTGE
ncbi:hypothetical protein XENOCAPTIV_006082 [Xenoophorus captivus]|uniref:Uncharacterized protein n=1 Tax=Xenoophorus captivus TaxID=1517983 RepID=A0ABV0RZ06_9TELE